MGSPEKCAEPKRIGNKCEECLYEGVIVVMTLYGAEAWSIRSDDRRKVNLLEMKCLKCLAEIIT